MKNNLTFNYQLTNDDYIKAEQIYLIQINTAEFLANILCGIFFLSIALINLYKIKDQYFLVPQPFKQFVLKEQTASDSIQSALIILFFDLLILGNFLPKYNPIYRWNLSKQHQQYFVRQEAKTLTISDDRISIISENYRTTRQWQNFNNFFESKQMFLLRDRREKTIIIPKRIFKTEMELNNFRSILTTKIAK